MYCAEGGFELGRCGGHRASAFVISLGNACFDEGWDELFSGFGDRELAAIELEYSRWNRSEFSSKQTFPE